MWLWKIFKNFDLLSLSKKGYKRNSFYKQALVYGSRWIFRQNVHQNLVVRDKHWMHSERKGTML